MQILDNNGNDVIFDEAKFTQLFNTPMIKYLNFHNTNQHSAQAKEKLKLLGNYAWDALIESVDDNENFNRYAKIINDIDNIIHILNK